MIDIATIIVGLGVLGTHVIWGMIAPRPYGRDAL